MNQLPHGIRGPFKPNISKKGLIFKLNNTDRLSIHTRVGVLGLMSGEGVKRLGLEQRDGDQEVLRDTHNAMKCGISAILKLLEPSQTITAHHMDLLKNCSSVASQLPTME